MVEDINNSRNHMAALLRTNTADLLQISTVDHLLLNMDLRRTSMEGPLLETTAHLKVNTLMRHRTLQSKIMEGIVNISSKDLPSLLMDSLIRTYHILHKTSQIISLLTVVAIVVDSQEVGTMVIAKRRQ